VTPVAQLAKAAPIAPPQNLEAEESVLGAMLLSPGAIGAVSEVLDASDFYRESHAKIYRAALALYAKGEPVDAITLVDELEERGELENVGGRVRLHELAALVPATANAAHYARIVREMATLRGLIAAGQQIAQLGWERPGETQILVDRAEQVVFELSQSRVSTEFSHIEELLKESFERITALYEAGADVTGVPSGFRDLDRLTSGFQPGNLVIVAARPSMGKSALGLCIAANLALRYDTPVALFTLEMSKSEVTQRLLCSEAKVESQRLRTGKLAQDDWPRLVAAGDKLMKAPIYVDDTGSITMMEIRSKARRLKTREPKLGLIIVDYLQLMTSGTTAENRVQEVSQISRNLKVLARDLDVPILAMSQLSRAVEQRHDKRPILSDLRESGCLTGESRVFLPDYGVYRPIRELVGRSGFRVLAVNTETWRLEPCVVTNAFATGHKPVYRLRTRLGRTIRATGNHKFLSFSGWRRLDDLGPGARIALPRRTEGHGRATMSEARRFPVSMGSKGRTIHRLDVQGRDDAVRFLTAIGAVGARKRRSFFEILSWFDSRGHNTNRDALPREVWHSIVVPAMERSGVTARALQSKIGTRYSGSTLYKVGLGRERALRVADVIDSDELAHLATSDVVWDEVLSIEPAGEEDVYDLTVEELHNFVADDIVVHNSIEQDSDLVIFVYRDEYYNEDTDQQGLAEIILSKHRNGPTGIERMSFLKRYAKFADLAAT
jgi:replicative DNA helicase